MFLPISDAPNPKNFTPWVTYGLIAANVLVYLLFTLPLSSSVDPDAAGLADYLIWIERQAHGPPYTLPEYLHQYGVEAVVLGLAEQGTAFSGWDLAIFNYGYRPSQGGIFNLFTSMFMHAGFLHLAGNMLFLWIYGDNVEHRLGRVGALVSYLLTGVVATLSFAMLNLRSGTPLVGASGAISGVLGLYFLLFSHNRVRVLIWLGFFVTTIQLPARIVLGIYVVVDNLLPLFTQAGGNVAYGAHLGGFIGGLGIAYIGERLEWNIPGSEARERKHRGPQILEFQTGKAILEGVGPNRAPEPDLARAIEVAIADQDPDRAIFHYVRALPQDHELISTESTAVLGEWLAERNFATSAAKLIRRRIRLVSGRARARLLLSLARVRKAQGQTTSAYQALLDALAHEPDHSLELQIKSELQQLTH